MRKTVKTILSSLLTVSIMFAYVAVMNKSVAAQTVEETVTITLSGRYHDDNNKTITENGIEFWGRHFNDDGCAIMNYLGIISNATITAPDGATITKLEFTATDEVVYQKADYLRVDNNEPDSSTSASATFYLNSNSVTVTVPEGQDICSIQSVSVTYSYEVSYNVNLTGGTVHATVSGGAVTQTGVTGEMDPVTYTAREGYHYDVGSETLNGITIERTETTIRVSGTPTADVTLQIPEAQADSYTPLLRMRADAARVILDIYLPYDGSQNLYTEWDDNQVTLQTTEIDGKSYGYFAITSAAKNMVDDHKLVVMLDQQEVCNKTFSMVDYLTRVIELSSSESDPYRVAAISMIRYASAAQLVFNYPTGVQENTPAIANYGIPEAQLSTLNDVVVPDTTPVSDIASIFERLRYSTYYGMNMTHTYDTVLLIAFRVNEGETIGTAVQEVRMSYFPDESAWTVTADSTRNYVIVKINVGVRAMETSVYTYTRVPGNVQTLILPSDYLGRISADDSRNMNLRYLCRALYLYYQAAVNIPAN